jgi:multiple sugar transport system permease protein
VVQTQTPPPVTRPSPRVARSVRRPYRRRRLRAPAHHLVLVLICAAFTLPFLIMLTTALKSPGDIFSVPPRLLPRQLTGENFGAATTSMPFGRYLVNTLLLVGANVAGTLLSCPLVAYSLTKIRWAGRTPLFFLVLATMMLPPQVTLVPVYKLWNDLGAVGTFWPLIVPQFLGTAFFIFMLRQFFLGIPDELVEAGRIDGASEFRIYWQIVLPLARPALATVAVFQFMWTWTDFLTPLLYLKDQSKYTLSIGLYSFFSERGVEWGPLMAACLMFTLPAIAIFIVAQRYFITGISVSGLK